MLFNVRRIPDEGLDVDFEISPESMKVEFQKGDELRDIFATDVACHLHFEIDQKEVFLTGQARTDITPICARCGDSFKQPFSVDLMLTCSPEKVRHGADSYQESDEGVIFYTHHELNLTEIVREQVLLTFPMRHLCSSDCKGLCSDCGANLNQGEHSCSRSTKKAVQI